LSVPAAVVGLGSILGTSLRQLSGPAEQVDFVAFYTGARLLLTEPSRLYDAGAWAVLQAMLHSEPLPVLEFWNPPHVALMLAPLAELPFGVAYVAWLVANLGCVGAACWLLLALGLRRAWRTLLLVCLVPLLACGLLGIVAGPAVLVSYARLAGDAISGVLGAAGPHVLHLDAGHSLLGLAQWLVGPSALATALAVAGTVGLGLLLAVTWRGGLRADPRRHLQLALLPLAATLSAPHALAYDATTWLASAWLAASFAVERPRARPLVVSLLLLGWWAGNLAALPRVGGLAPWGALGGIGCLAGLTWLYARCEGQTAW
jgi:hypothetical protein